MGGKRNEEGMAGKKRVDRVRSDSLQGFCAFVGSWWVIGVVGRPQGRYADRQRYWRHPAEDRWENATILGIMRDHDNARDETIRIYGRSARHEDRASRAI